MSKQVNYQEFITTLKKTINEKMTTNLILLTEDKHSLWLGLEKGIITTIIFGPKRGESAIPHISRINGGKLSLDTKINLPSMPLPSTELILTKLLITHTADDADSFTVHVDAARMKMVVDKLGLLFKRHVGPIAEILLPRIVKKIGEISTDAQIKSMIDEMVKEVDGIRDTAKFRQEAADIIETVRTLNE